MRRVEEKLVLKKSIKKGIKKLMFVIIIGLSTMIVMKSHPSTKDWIQKHIYEDSLPFLKMRNLYEKYMSILPKEETQPVWSENSFYQKEEKTDTGLKLTVKENSSIPSIESGILVFKDDQKAIIEQVDGVSAIYNNIKIKDYKLYDYLEKGDILGESSASELTIDFQKNGEYFDYQKNI